MSRVVTGAERENMLTPAEKAAAYLQKLETDRSAAIAASEEKALEAKLIKSRQEGFQEALKLLGVDLPIVSEETKCNEEQRRPRRNIKELILREISFSGSAMTTNQIAGAIAYLSERTEEALKGLERSGRIVRDEDGRWALPITLPRRDLGGVSSANGKLSSRNGEHVEVSP